MQASNQLGLKDIFDCATIRKPKLFKELGNQQGQYIVQLFLD